MNLVLWVVQGGLALSCVFSGMTKAFRPLAKVQQLFPWANHVPAALVRFIGVSECLGGIGLVLPSAVGIFPWLTVAAAAGLALLMLCAALFHASRREFPSIGANAVLLLLSMVIVIGRWAWV
jgi:putative oxidoreductase